MSAMQKPQAFAQQRTAMCGSRGNTLPVAWAGSRMYLPLPGESADSDASLDLALGRGGLRLGADLRKGACRLPFIIAGRLHLKEGVEFAHEPLRIDILDAIGFRVRE